MSTATEIWSLGDPLLPSEAWHQALCPQGGWAEESLLAGSPVRGSESLRQELVALLLRLIGREEKTAVQRKSGARSGNA